MDNKKIMVFTILGLFVFGSLGMMSFGSKKTTTGNVISNQQQGETQSEMMARMHPDRQANNDMSGHHGESSASENLNTIKSSDLLGKTASDFTLTDQDDSGFTLSDYKNKTVVLFFSGGAMCYPACWNQIEELGADERFNNDNVVTASVVVDAKEKWDKIISSQPKYGAGTILFDTNKAVSQAYGMLDAQSSMHKGSFPGHTYLVIKNGVISYILDDPKMAINTDEVASEL